jgi:hypothetical protein
MDIILLQENLSELDLMFKELPRKPNKSQTEIEEKERIRLELEAALKKDEQRLINDL